MKNVRSFEDFLLEGKQLFLGENIFTDVFDYVWVLKLLQQVNLLQEMHLLLLFKSI
jgi:hypothetical protein